MADYISDSPNPAVGPGRNQRTPSTATQHKRSNNDHRNRKNNQQQFDGAVSDGLVAQAPGSPHSKRSHKQRQSAALGAAPGQQQNGNNMGRANSVQNQRPVSMAGPGVVPDTPAKEEVYAGAKFQDSPAASALPMPKYFSKSLPNNAAGRNSLQAKLAQERVQSGRESSSPESDSASPAPQPPPREAQQSPLDFFFQADKAEKQRNMSGSNSRSPELPRSSQPSSTSQNPFQQSGRSVFLSELDGDDLDRLSPRTIRPPFAERAKSSPGAANQFSRSESDRQAKTQSLKDILWNTTANASSTTPASQSRNHSGSQTPDGVFGSPSPFQRSSGPSTPQPTSEQQQNHYSLHYGNRNLSPLFKAAQSDTPPRPSSLRQELPNNSASITNSAVDLQPPPAHHQGTVDHSTFARSYLQEQIRNSGPAQMPQLPWQSGPKPIHASSGAHHPNSPSTGSVSIPVQPVNAQHGVSASSPASSVSGHSTPRTAGGSRDIDAMQNDLRRILKLNVVG
ncbi:Hypothetical predicted protein [Lecanosticta acicola]|uniref:Proteophosphoglycan 5 n=1 Tax=Lecanosticta acicola TaxID=111012 RepID=A0AAI8YW78_9PEZI|nr:Hypothetical predicted protein [Lecanosticta acicola]